MKRILFLIIALALLSFSNDQNFKKGPEVIDLFNAFRNKKEVNLSRFVGSVEYIPLELTPECAVGDARFFEVTDEFIIYRQVHQILLFDRHTGKFIREVGKYGRGPNEYDIPPNEDFYNFDTKVLYTYGTAWKELLTFNLKGEMVEKFPFPTWTEPTARNGMLYAIFRSYLDNKTFAFSIINEFGLAKDKLVLFTKDGILKKFPNYTKFPNEYNNKQRGTGPTTDEFLRWDGKLYFKDPLNDTLFQVTKDVLLPRFVFKSDKYSFPYGLQYKLYAERTYTKYDDYFFIKEMFENSGYLFFQLWYQKTFYTGFYDKKTKKTELCDGLTSYNYRYIGLKDDINGFMAIVPFRFTPKNELITAFDGIRIKKWVDQNPEQAKNLEKKFNWLKGIDEMSNPVIFIAKSKD
jgi:hypothetical protein